MDASIEQLLERREYGLALTAAHDLLQATAQRVGTQRGSYAASLAVLARVYATLGYPEHAEALYEQALTVFDGCDDGDFREMAKVLVALGVVAVGRHDLASAERYFSRARARIESNLGRQAPELVCALCSLATVVDLQGDKRRALELYQRALDLGCVPTPDGHTDFADLLHSVARYHEVEGHFERAEPLRRRAVAMLESALGEDAPATAQSVHRLALHHGVQQEHERALALFGRSLSALERLYGPDDARLIDDLHYMVIHFRALGQSERAAQAQARVTALASAEQSRRAIEAGACSAVVAFRRGRAANVYDWWRALGPMALSIAIRTRGSLGSMAGNWVSVLPTDSTCCSLGAACSVAHAALVTEVQRQQMIALRELEPVDDPVVTATRALARGWFAQANESADPGQIWQTTHDLHRAIAALAAEYEATPPRPATSFDEGSQSNMRAIYMLGAAPSARSPGEVERALEHCLRLAHEAGLFLA